MSKLEEDDGIVKDGQVVRVPLVMMDAVQRSVSAAAVSDGMGGRAGSRPGYVFPYHHDAAAADAREDRIRRLSSAWRQPPAAAPRVAESEGKAIPEDELDELDMLADGARADRVRRLENAWRS